MVWITSVAILLTNIGFAPPEPSTSQSRVSRVEYRFTPVVSEEESYTVLCEYRFWCDSDTEPCKIVKDNRTYLRVPGRWEDMPEWEQDQHKEPIPIYKDMRHHPEFLCTYLGMTIKEVTDLIGN